MCFLSARQEALRRKGTKANLTIRPRIPRNFSCKSQRPCARCTGKGWTCSNKVEGVNAQAVKVPAFGLKQPEQHPDEIQFALDPTAASFKRPRSGLSELLVADDPSQISVCTPGDSPTATFTGALVCDSPEADLALPLAAQGSAGGSDRVAAMLHGLYTLLMSVSYEEDEQSSGQSSWQAPAASGAGGTHDLNKRTQRLVKRAASAESAHFTVIRQMRKQNIKVHEVVRRLRVLLTSGNLQAVRAAAAASGGHLPLNLLAPIAPHLTSQLKALLVATSAGGAPLPHGALSEYVFDGLHLTLLGFAGCVVAWGRGEEMVVVPEGCAVVQAPTHRVSASGDGGSADVRVMDGVGGYGVEPWCARVPLGDVCARWGHLLSVITAPGEEEVEEAEGFLLAQEQKRDVDVPPLLLSLYIEFMQGIAVPVTHSVSTINPAKPAQAFGLNRASCQLNGYTFEKLVGGLSNDIDEDPDSQIRFAHPSSALQQVISSLGASNSNLLAHQTAGQQLRRAVLPRDSPAQPTATLVPYFAMTTRHVELFPSGKVRCETLYTSDIIMCRNPESMCAMPTIADDLNLLENLLTPDSAEALPEVRRALNSSKAVGKMEAILQILDMDFCERAWLRLLMLARFEDDRLLRGYLEAQSTLGAAEADPADTSKVFAPMRGLTRNRLERLRAKFHSRLGEDILNMAVACIAACSAATAQSVPVYIGGRTDDMEFPGPRQTKMLLRFGL